ncbi:DUF2243 domain-containing protein [Salsuginibacillus kocurii]|uniref:DUF2243 domain-containing protein n=1 Tax=Salsuginibacillus kocurii TaxID=427078 RepID=UPI0003A3B210|nr:DUF2243 domain-containing protein [Salsuginibacillus kocurii]
MLYRVASFLIGVLFVDYLFHTDQAQALGFEAETMGERLGALAFVGGITLVFFYICYRFFARSFFNGSIFAAGFFASFDVVVVHWIFQLHRITDGPEAIYIEVFLVILGLIMMVFSVFYERREKDVAASLQT